MDQVLKFSFKQNNIKILEKSGNFASPEKWEPCRCFGSEGGVTTITSH